MAYDRYDSRDQNRGYRDDRQRDPRSGGGNERGFFDRAIDSVSNFFSDDDHDDRHRDPQQQQQRGMDRSQERTSFQGSNRYLGSEGQRRYEPQAYDQDQARQSRERENDRFGVSDRSTTYSGGQSNSYARGRDDGDYRNQYGRGGGESGGFGRGDYGHQGENYYSRQGQDYGDLRSGGRSYPSGYGQTGGGSYRETQHQQYGGRSHDDDHQSGRYQAQGSDRYRPMTGEASRSSNEQGRQGSGFGAQDFRSEQYGRQDFSQDQDRDRGQRGQGSGFMGAAAGAASSMFGGARSTHDEHYQSWRQRQIEELDRDYDEYRREHQSRFENEFHGFRQQRQTKRQMLQSIREHFEVVDESGQHIGTVDKVRGDKIIMTKNDPEAGGVHRSFTCSLLERVEDNKVYLSGSKDSIRSRLTEEQDDQYRSQSSSSSSGGGIMGALFGSSEDRSEQTSSQQQGVGQHSGEGPHVLDRSFSGTYDDDGSAKRK
jgi:hypothetical protein